VEDIELFEGLIPTGTQIFFFVPLLFFPGLKTPKYHLSFFLLRNGQNGATATST